MSTLIQLSPASGITVGTTSVTSGTDTRVFFQQGGVVQQDANFTFNNTQKRLTLRAVGTAATDIPFIIRNNADTTNLVSVNGLGRTRFSFDSTGTDFIAIEPQLSEIAMVAYSGLKMMSLTNSQSFFGFGVGGYKMGVGNNSPQARLDVRAQGALSTDIAFRVRNSADSVTLQQFNGDGSWLHRNNANTFYEYFDGTSRIEYRRVGNVELGTNNDVTQFRFVCNVGDVFIRGGTNLLSIVNNNNFHFEESTGLLPTSGAGCIVMKNRTAPSTNVQDRFYLYSADIVAGNAAPHFRTEAGDIIKLYKQASAGITTVADLVTVLTNLGLLA